MTAPPAPASLKERARSFIAKLLSIKFLVFVVGTALLMLEKITPVEWLVLASAIMGIRTLEKKLWQDPGE